MLKDDCGNRSIFDKPPPITIFMGINGFIDHIKTGKGFYELSWLTTNKQSFEWVECQEEKLYEKLKQIEIPFNAHLGWFSRMTKETKYETIGVNES